MTVCVYACVYACVCVCVCDLCGLAYPLTFFFSGGASVGGGALGGASWSMGMRQSSGGFDIEGSLSADSWYAPGIGNNVS